MKEDLKNKKVLVVGLGTLGGGVATARWFVKRGAQVTVTDLRSRKELLPSIRALGPAGKKVKFVLGKHRVADFKRNDLVVVNPAVPRENPYLAVARKAGKEITNDAGIFFDLVTNPLIAVTGTRGKTTTTNWIAHFVRGAHRRAVAGGNTPDMPLLSAIERLKDKETPAIVELSSWQLERLGEAKRGPDVAIITNLYSDHLNRYRGLIDYARAKANIFKRQGRTGALILNAGNQWTPFFLKQKPKSAVYFFSLTPLKTSQNGIYLDRGIHPVRSRSPRGGRSRASGGAASNGVYFKEGTRRTLVADRRTTDDFLHRGAHNVQNLLAAMLAAHLAGIPWHEIKKRIATLPQIPLREEIISTRGNLMVVNDTTATSPDGAVAAIERFKHKNLILIAGGTDKKLAFRDWARAVKRRVKPEHLFLLEGNATEKMLRALRAIHYFTKSYPQLFTELPQLLRAVKQKTRQKGHFTVLFSPGAASFEKFKNEFDRGRKFNLYWKQTRP